MILPADAAGALRAGQGDGARYDAPNAPAEDLLLARRGTAYFARLLNGLSDAALNDESARPPLSRRAIVAMVAYDARDQSATLAAIRTGTDLPDPVARSAAMERIELASTLPAHALRALFHHSSVHVNTEWRDLTEAGWTDARALHAHAGRPVAELPLLRARMIYRAATQLGAGGRASDIPSKVGSIR